MVLIVGLIATATDQPMTGNRKNSSSKNQIKENSDSLRLVAFKQKMEKANTFLWLASGRKHSLDDTLWVKAGEEIIGIWVKHFWGSQRKALYEIAIGDRFDQNKVVVLPAISSNEIKINTEHYYRAPYPGSEEFYFCFEGLLRTFCKQHGYEFPSLE